jgi:hypothetical protein
MWFLEQGVKLVVAMVSCWFTAVYGGLAVLVTLAMLDDVIPLPEIPLSTTAGWMLAFLIFLGCGAAGAGGAWWAMSRLFRAAPMRRGPYHLDPPA